MRVIFADIECDGLLDELTKLHCMVAKDSKTGEVFRLTDLEDVEGFLELYSDVPLVMHNGICFDKPALEKLGVKVPNRIIDTLPLSWYLYPKRQRHGLAEWGEELGVPKPPIDDWKNLSVKQYLHRCEEDVKIQELLWNKLFSDLQEVYRKGTKKIKNGKTIITNDGDVDTKTMDRFMRYLEAKMGLQARQQEHKWKSDLEECNRLRMHFENQITDKTEELRLVMPEVPKYRVKNRPKVMFKKNGEMSVRGKEWLELLESYCKENGLDFEKAKSDSEIGKLTEINVMVGTDIPNPNSVKQKKDWLFSLGWEPETFKYVKEKEVVVDPRTGREKTKFSERKIPQITTDDGALDPGILRLVKDHPELSALEGLGVLNHRNSIVKGFISDMDENGYLVAGASGFTNTLRMKHRTLVNIPSTRAAYGKEIRSLLKCEDGELLCGSDLSSLEDRIKHHFQMPLDPEYVKSQMSDDFDPHLLMCQEANLLAPSDVARYKRLDKLDHSEWSDDDQEFMSRTKEIRHQGKGCNYACQYGAKPPTVARSAGVSNSIGEALYNAYWSVNWSIKEIAKNTEVKRVGSNMYQKNPINGFWYWLKNDKDRFSTLIQGSGSYIFDLWSFYILKLSKERFGKEIPYLGQFHDEVILRIKDNPKSKQVVEKLIRDAIHMVNKKLKLNRDMDVDVQFGKTYADIH